MLRMTLAAVVAVVLSVGLLVSSIAVETPAIVAPAQTPARGPFRAEIRIGRTLRPVNRRVLGSNIQWVDRGDGLLSTDGAALDPQMLELVRTLGPTVLRYPGGSHADTFDWRAGTGSIRNRGSSEHFLSRQRQPVLFGTAEFLELCRRLAAEPIITVNTVTGSPRDAADWVRSVNRAVDGTVAGRVHFWEVGNEPYLREDFRPEVAVEPRAFAARANAFVRAMREADPTIAIGVPLRRDRLGVLPAVAFPGYAETVLAAIDERVDFVSLHNAYMPFITGDVSRFSPEDIFGASMAAYQVVEEDLSQTRALLERYRPGPALPFAITEYNAFFTLGGALDAHIATLGGALYIADLLRVLATRDDVLMANFWSLTGNWWFGTVSNDRRTRPAYEVLRAYSEILRGQLLDVAVTSPTFAAPAVGAVPATAGIPLIAGVATAEGGRQRILLINKSDRDAAIVSLRDGPAAIMALRVRELSAMSIYDRAHEHSLAWRDLPIDDAAAPLRLPIAPHSLLWVEFDTR